MTRQLISTNRQLLLRHVTRSVRRAAGFVQVPFGDMVSDFPEPRFWIAPELPVLLSEESEVDRVGHCQIARIFWIHVRWFYCSNLPLGSSNRHTVNIPSHIHAPVRIFLKPDHRVHVSRQFVGSFCFPQFILGAESLLRQFR